MKKPQKPLVYLVHPSLMDTDEIKERVDKGHEVIQNVSFKDYDMVIGPNCFRLSKETINLLPLAEKAARLSKYGERKTKGAKDETE